MAEQIGIIGLGIMGSAYARNLSQAGLEIVGCEIDDAKVKALADVRLLRAATPADVAARVDRIVTSLPNAAAFSTVMGELARAGRPVVVADTCTLTVADKEAGRAMLAKAGAVLLDCPVGGTGAQVGAEVRRDAHGEHGDRDGQQERAHDELVRLAHDVEEEGDDPADDDDLHERPDPGGKPAYQREREEADAHQQVGDEEGQARRDADPVDEGGETVRSETRR